MTRFCEKAKIEYYLGYRLMETTLNHQDERAEEIKLFMLWLEKGFGDWQEEA